MVECVLRICNILLVTLCDPEIGVGPHHQQQDKYPINIHFALFK